MNTYWCYTPLELIIFMFIKLLKMRFHPSSPNFVRGVIYVYCMQILKNALTDEQLCSLTCLFICLLKQVWKYSFIYHIWNQKEQTELSELNELKCSKIPSQMSSCAHKHIFLYLHAQVNINTLLYWSYTK